MSSAVALAIDLYSSPILVAFSNSNQQDYHQEGPLERRYIFRVQLHVDWCFASTRLSSLVPTIEALNPISLLLVRVYTLIYLLIRMSRAPPYLLQLPSKWSTRYELWNTKKYIVIKIATCWRRNLIHLIIKFRNKMWRPYESEWHHSSKVNP
jgi:hypothetical protein